MASIEVGATVFGFDQYLRSIQLHKKTHGVTWAYANVVPDAFRRPCSSHEYYAGPHHFFLHLPESQVHLRRLDPRRNRHLTSATCEHSRCSADFGHHSLFRWSRGDKWGLGHTDILYATHSAYIFHPGNILGADY